LEALRLADELGILEDQADILAKLAISYARLGELDRAQAHMHAAWDLVDQLQQGIEYIRLARVEVMLRSGAREAALRELSTAEGATGPPQIRAWACCYRAMAALLDGDGATARPLLGTAVELAADAGDMPLLASAVHLCAAVALVDDDPAPAAYLLGVATALRGAADLSGFDNLLRPAERARALLEDAAFASAYDSGAALTRDAAIQAIRPT
jgi:tetratricopeptide (TPR) repeat protein